MTTASLCSKHHLYDLVADHEWDGVRTFFIITRYTGERKNKESSIQTSQNRGMQPIGVVEILVYAGGSELLSATNTNMETALHRACKFVKDKKGETAMH